MGLSVKQFALATMLACTPGEQVPVGDAVYGCEDDPTGALVISGAREVAREALAYCEGFSDGQRAECIEDIDVENPDADIQKICNDASQDCWSVMENDQNECQRLEDRAYLTCRDTYETTLAACGTDSICISFAEVELDFCEEDVFNHSDTCRENATRAQETCRRECFLAEQQNACAAQYVTSIDACAENFVGSISRTVGSVCPNLTEPVVFTERDSTTGALILQWDEELDSDGDGKTNGAEVRDFKTNPCRVECEGEK